MTGLNVDNRTIFCHDNLDVLQGINSDSIDLIYLDPPFNKNKRFMSPVGSSAEGADFDDIFREEDVKDEWLQTIKEDHLDLYTYLEAVKIIGKPFNFPYLAYMGIRLLECHRILRGGGSIYLHCDHTMSHYIKTTMDCIFGEDNFRNEITWQRASGRAKGSQYKAKRFGCDVDSILYYSQSKQHVLEDIHIPLSSSEMDEKFPHTDEQGRRYNTDVPIFCSPSMKPAPSLCYTYRGVANPHPSGWRVKKDRLEAMDKNGQIIWREGKRPLRKSFADDYKGKPLGSLWADIPNVTGGKERLNYSTQKPVALLERIIKASSNEGDTVLDPFCGCATTCVAAERLDRKWIGIDVSEKAHDMVKKRLIKEAATEDDMFKYQNEIIFKIYPPKRTDQDDDHREQKWVYVISNPSYPGEYKVGIARDPKARLNQYQTSDPARAYKIEFQHQTPAFRETETHIHTQFDNKHEWVTGNLGEIINAIKTFKP